MSWETIENFSFDGSVFKSDDLRFVTEVYGKRLSEFLDTKNFAIMFFAESEDFADEVVPTSSTNINLEDYSFSFLQDFSFDRKNALKDFNYCKINEMKFAKIITPFTRSRSYDFIVTKFDEAEEIVKALTEKRRSKYSKRRTPPHVIGIPIKEIEKKTIDFLLDEDLRNYCIERDIPLKRGVIFEGAPGCLSKDTILFIKSEKDRRASPYTIEEAYHKFNRIETKNIKGRSFWKENNKKFIQSMVNNQIEFREIEAIIYSGEKEVFEVSLENGLKIKATSDHTFKVPEENILGRGNLEKDNFVPLEKLKVGEEIYCKNILKEKIYKPKGRQGKRKEVTGLKYHPYAWEKKTGKYSYKRTFFYRLVVEASMNNIELNEYINILKNDEEKSKTLKFLSGDMIVHHKDGNTQNNDLINLEVLTKKEHDAIHGNNKYFSDTLLVLSKITSIEKIGVEKTFDITMKGNSKNFLANNIVVHNCGKSMTLKYLKTKADSNDISFEIFDDIDSFIKNSYDYYKEEKKIFVFEDFDTALLSRDNTGGTPNQVLGKVLNTLDGIREIDNVVSIFTTNKIKLFDDAFIRPGRIDTVFTFQLPTEENIKTFIDKYLFDIDKEVVFKTILEVRKTTNISFAFLKGIADDLNIYNFFEGKNPPDDEIKRIIKERTYQTNKLEEKDTSNYIL